MCVVDVRLASIPSLRLTHVSVMLAARRRELLINYWNRQSFAAPHTHIRRLAVPLLLRRFPNFSLWHSSARVSEQRNICWRGKFDFERKLSLKRVSSAPQLARIRKFSKYVCTYRHLSAWGSGKACENRLSFDGGMTSWKFHHFRSTLEQQPLVGVDEDRRRRARVNTKTWNVNHKLRQLAQVSSEFVNFPYFLFRDISNFPSTFSICSWLTQHASAHRKQKKLMSKLTRIENWFHHRFIAKTTMIFRSAEWRS